MILTEEELKKLHFTANERSRSGLITDHALNDMYKIIKSHTELIKANAELSFKNNELQKKFNTSLEWLETIEKEFYHETDSELERCRSQAKCAREQLTCIIP